MNIKIAESILYEIVHDIEHILVGNPELLENGITSQILREINGFARLRL